VPLSLLLTQQLTILTAGAAKLARWEAITDTFALIARRLRSAFLVRWFGTALPVDGVDLRITLANLGDLRARYGLVTGPSRGGSGAGPNLTEPLLGGAGMLAGALAWPLNAMVGSMIIGSLVSRWWQQLLAGLGWVSAGGLVTAALLLSAPLLALGLIAEGLGGGSPDTYDLLGALAAMAAPLRRLWAQLSGAEPARNPLLAQLMTLGDRLAALLAQILGAVAVAVTRIAPLVAPVVDAARATIAAVVQIVGAITAVVQDMFTVYDLIAAGPYSVTSIIASVVGAVQGLVRRLRLLVTTTLHTMIGIALARVGPTIRAVVHYVVDAARLAAAVILDTAFVHWLLALRGLADAFGRWSRRPGPPTSSSPPSPWATSFPAPPSVRALRRGLGLTPVVAVPTITAPPWLDTDTIAPIAGAMAQGALPAPPDPFALRPDQRGALGRFRRPPSIRGDLLALGTAQQQRRAGGGAGQVFALADVYGAIGPRLTRTIEVLAPAQAATLLPGIEGLLGQFDLQLRKHALTHPTRELPEPDSVRPVVGRLVVRGPGGPPAQEEMAKFVAALRAELDARTYLSAPGPGTPSATATTSTRSRPPGVGR
jgi:hypothetical protein